MMKRLFALLIALMLPLCACAEEATALPFGVSFQMDYAATLKALGEGVTQEDWGDQTGMLLLEGRDIGLGALKADSASFQVDRNNSDLAPRLTHISMTLAMGDDCLADFREALAAVSAAYGQPDADPFDENGVQYYVEFGSLSASWTKPDVRINLSMSRMFANNLSLDFANRLCYDAADLAE